jgi:hypothetical protein
MGTGARAGACPVSLPVVFRPEAEAEFEEAQAWYEERLRGLGQEFVTSVQATINLVSRNPGHIAGLESVTIIAVFHTSRDPAVWRDRGR